MGIPTAPTSICRTLKKHAGRKNSDYLAPKTTRLFISVPSSEDVAGGRRTTLVVLCSTASREESRCAAVAEGGRRGGGGAVGAGGGARGGGDRVVLPTQNPSLARFTGGRVSAVNKDGNARSSPIRIHETWLGRQLNVSRTTGGSIGAALHRRHRMKQATPCRREIDGQSTQDQRSRFRASRTTLKQESPWPRPNSSRILPAELGGGEAGPSWKLPRTVLCGRSSGNHSTVGGAEPVRGGAIPALAVRAGWRRAGAEEEDAIESWS